MSAPTSSATIEFPFSLIDGEIRKVLEDYGVQFKRKPFNPVLELDDPLYDLEVEGEDGGIFRLQNGEARYGEFEELETLLIQKGIPFDRDSSMDWDREPGTRIFRPGDPPLDLWLEDFPGKVADALKGLIRTAAAVLPSFASGTGTPAWRKEQGCVPRLYDDEALALEVAIAEAKKIFPEYPPLTSYVKEADRETGTD